MVTFETSCFNFLPFLECRILSENFFSKNFLVSTKKCDNVQKIITVNCILSPKLPRQSKSPPNLLK